jgi:two-component system chemotaxis response regulator CheY
VVPAYGNVRQSIGLLAESRADLLLLCYNDIGRCERFYLDLRREVPADLGDAFQTIVMCYRGHDATAAQLCLRHDLLDYVVAGPTLDVQRLHHALKIAVRRREIADQRNELNSRMQRAAHVVDELLTLSATARTVAQELGSAPDAVRAQTVAAAQQLLARIEATAELGRQANVLGKRSVLIVDDDPLLRDICATSLAAGGYHVLQAGDAAEGLHLLESDKVSLILMDLMLPGLDGIAATRKIRAIQRHRSTPILMLTGHSDPETVKTCGQAGASGFIVKPVEQGALLDKVRKQLAGP